LKHSVPHPLGIWAFAVANATAKPRVPGLRLSFRPVMAPFMASLVKICGLSTPEAVNSALAGGASFIGFVFFERSPRNIAPQTAARLAASAKARNVQTVALAVDPSNEQLDEIMAQLKPNLIQLHGSETPARVHEVKTRGGVDVIKAVPVSTSLEVAHAARDFDAIADFLMFDAKPPEDAERPGGNGVAFDWDILNGVRLQRPWFLAGGLDPWIVGEAIKRSGAKMVDVSSGVERGAGLKDPALIAAFLDAVKRA
jgi:phosphoribosylanthranilate isomerase